jgi:ComF family protein
MIIQILSYLVHLVFPNSCLICGESLSASEAYLCLECRFKLPKTNFHLQNDNPVEKRFWGKVHIEKASAFLHFQKGGAAQTLLHHLKYKGEKEVGFILGKFFALELQAASFCNTIDLIVPVPLHINRFRKRGYNQSEWIAKGLSEVLQIPIESSALVRTVENQTQTKKTVYERWENTANIFSVTDKSAFENKHILLVDDVLTTGSTLEACAQAIKEKTNAKVSIVTLALA